MASIEKIRQITVIGAGTMGREIAQVTLMSGLFESIYLIDIDNDILKKAKVFINKGLEKIESKNRLKPGLTSNELMRRLHLSTDLTDATKNAEFIIEAIPEIMQLKKDLFTILSKNTLEHAILATNTSTMSITEIASAYKNPENVIGMHFFTPVPVLRLIELIKGAKTSNETFEISLSVAQNLPSLKGKRFVARIEKESPGFIVNRLTIASGLYLNWLLDVASEQGIPISSVDNDFTTPPDLGPFAKWDYLGLDVISNAMKYFKERVSPEFEPGKTISSLLEKGYLGKKTGRGIYEWNNNGPKWSTNEKASLGKIEYYFAIQLNEGCRLLEEKVVSGFKIIDDAMIAGMDMPGPFGAGKKNYKTWSELLEKLVVDSGITYFKPCDLMKSGGFINMKK